MFLLIGSVAISGGVGVAKKLFVGGSVFVQSTADASSTSVGGSLSVAGGASIAKKLYVADSVYLTLGADSSSTSVVLIQ